MHKAAAVPLDSEVSPEVAVSSVSAASPDFCLISRPGPVPQLRTSRSKLQAAMAHCRCLSVMILTYQHGLHRWW